MEWLEEIAATPYPFIQPTTVSDYLLDIAVSYVPTGEAAAVKVTSLTSGMTGETKSVSMGLLINGETYIALATKAVVSTCGDYKLITWVDSDSGVSVSAVFDAAKIDDTPWLLSFEAAELVPSVCTRVPGVNLVFQTTVGETVNSSGLVRLESGYNAAIEESSNAVTVRVVPGLGMGKKTVDVCNTGILSINNQRPDTSGNIQIKADECLIVRPIENGLNIQDVCVACAACRDFYNTTSAIVDLMNFGDTQLSGSLKWAAYHNNVAVQTMYQQKKRLENLKVQVIATPSPGYVAGVQVLVMNSLPYDVKLTSMELAVCYDVSTEEGYDEKVMVLSDATDSSGPFLLYTQDGAKRTALALTNDSPAIEGDDTTLSSSILDEASSGDEEWIQAAEVGPGAVLTFPSKPSDTSCVNIVGKGGSAEARFNIRLDWEDIETKTEQPIRVSARVTYEANIDRTSAAWQRLLPFEKTRGYDEEAGKANESSHYVEVTMAPKSESKFNDK